MDYFAVGQLIGKRSCIKLTDVTAKVVIYEAFCREEARSAQHLARTVHELYFEPRNGAFIHKSSDPSNDAFTAMARVGGLPNFCFVWSPNGYDERAPERSKDPDYPRKGHDLTWHRIDAVVQEGEWSNTVFILIWDDWGGYADHVVTPNAETVIDDLHPDGFQLIGGSRIPLIMFGGQVAQGVESNWHSHACICKTVIDQFGLHPSACRVSTAPSRSRVASAEAWPVPNCPPLALRSCSPLHQIPHRTQSLPSCGTVRWPHRYRILSATMALRSLRRTTPSFGRPIRRIDPAASNSTR